MLTVVFLAALTLCSGGCVRRIISSRGFGLLHSQRQRATATTAKRSPLQSSVPDDLVRQIFLRQTRDAYEPLAESKTVSMLETRLRLDSKDVPARLQLASIYERFSLAEQAAEQYKVALDDAAGPSESGLPKNPLQAQSAAEGLARSARSAGQSTAAIPALADFVRRWPVAGVWNELGMLYDDAGDTLHAEEAFRRAVAREPTSESLHNNLGYNLLLQQKTGEAEAEFRRALEINGKSAAAHNNIGTLLARRGEADAAFQHFRMAASDVATAHNNLAVVLLEMGAYERSRNELVKALSARYYFAAPMQNFKLVQELLRQRAELMNAGTGLPLRTISASLARAATPPTSFTQSDARLPTASGVAKPEFSEEP